MHPDSRFYRPIFEQMLLRYKKLKKSQLDKIQIKIIVKTRQGSSSKEKKNMISEVAVFLNNA